MQTKIPQHYPKSMDSTTYKSTRAAGTELACAHRRARRHRARACRRRLEPPRPSCPRAPPSPRRRGLPVRAAEPAPPRVATAKPALLRPRRPPALRSARAPAPPAGLCLLPHLEIEERTK
ncbi:unnamed protein product [Urochloa humidicola]